MKRDVLEVPFDKDMLVLVASDNSGSIGTQPYDDVSVPDDVSAYFSFRVAYMECVAAGGVPFAVILQNFNGDEAWSVLMKGIERGVTEAGIKGIPITGSTETNFPLQQSAHGISVLGKKERYQACFVDDESPLYIALIGLPLVGNEVIEQKENIAPLALFQWFTQADGVLTVLPVGSHGVIHELQELSIPITLEDGLVLDLKQSSGPATCFICVYQKSCHPVVKEKSGHFYHYLGRTRTDSVNK